MWRERKCPCRRFVPCLSSSPTGQVARRREGLILQFWLFQGDVIQASNIHLAFPQGKRIALQRIYSALNKSSKNGRFLA